MRGIEKREEGISIATYFVIIGIILGLIGTGIYIATRPPEEEGVVVGEVHSLSVIAESSVTAGDTSSITVYAYDAEGNLVSGANISLLYTIPGELDPLGGVLGLVDQGDGSYTSSLISQWAGTYRLTARADPPEVPITASSEIRFIPGEVANVITEFVSPMVNFYFLDAYGNVVPPDEVIEPWVTTSFGELGHVQTNPDNTFSVELILDDWGVAEVTVKDNNTGVSGSIEVEYPSIYLEVTTEVPPLGIELALPKENLVLEVTENENQKISARLSVDIPYIRGWLGYYEMTVQYDSSVLRLSNISDGDPTDGFTTPENIVLSENSIQIYQWGVPVSTITDVAVLDFQPLEHIDSTPIFVTDVFLIDYETEEEIEIPPPPENVTENGKTFKRVIIPIKAWIVEGSGVSEDNVRSDVDRAENIFNTNALACRLKYWFVFIVEINHIPKSEWDNKVPDGDIEGTEGVPNETQDNQRKKLISQNKWGRWLNVYYVPDSFEGIGWRTDDVIFIEGSGHDYKNRIPLAHELIHEFTKSWAKDSPAGNAAAQGARRPKNIMNYGDIGGNISPEQGRKINEEIDKRREDTLYKPYGPGPAPPP